MRVARRSVLLILLALVVPNLLRAQQTICERPFQLHADADLGIRNELDWFSQSTEHQVSFDIQLLQQQLPLLREQRESTLGTAEKVAESIRRISPEFAAKTVLYPAAGYDLDTVFKVFPDASLVVGIDNHPFVANTENPLVSTFPSHDFRHVTSFESMDHEDSILLRGLERLAVRFPNLRVRKVKFYISNHGATKQKQNDHMIFSDSERRARHRVHGLIEFDQGDNTRVQQYVHIDAVIDQNSKTLRPFLKEISKTQFNGLLLKGAMRRFWLSEEPFRSWMVSLYQRDSIFVDADGNYRNWDYRLTGFHRQGLIPGIKLGYHQSYVYASFSEMHYQSGSLLDKARRDK